MKLFYLPHHCVSCAVLLGTLIRWILFK